MLAELRQNFQTLLNTSTHHTKHTRKLTSKHASSTFSVKKMRRMNGVSVVSLICWCRAVLIRIYLIACGSDGDCEEKGETCVDGRCKSNESPDINVVIKLEVSSKTWHPFNKMHTFMIAMSKNRGKTKSPSTRRPRCGELI
jgi:hypothetical protein